MGSGDGLRGEGQLQGWFCSLNGNKDPGSLHLVFFSKKTRLHLLAQNFPALARGPLHWPGLVTADTVTDLLSLYPECLASPGPKGAKHPKTAPENVSLK